MAQLCSLSDLVAISEAVLLQSSLLHLWQQAGGHSVPSGGMRSPALSNTLQGLSLLCLCLQLHLWLPPCGLL